MPALDLVSSDTRRELLQFVKRRGSLSLDEAMEALDMARTTVREHLLFASADSAAPKLLFNRTEPS